MRLEETAKLWAASRAFRATRVLAWAGSVLALVACSGGTKSETGDPPPSGRYGLGAPATPEVIAAQDIDIGPAGAELPEGKGSVAEGAKVYGAKCASCHGMKGEGIAPFPKLVGRDPRDGFPFGRDPALVKTIGNYWPHATTLFDYVRRSMPFLQPGSLSNDEVYAVTAWLLAQNEIIPVNATLDAAMLKGIKMPARDRFVRDDRKGGAEVR
jgi:mono/diheme cytochrome c family protein